MELFNSEGKKLRKKDTEAYYYEGKKLAKIPDMSSSEDEVYEFVKKCMSFSHPTIKGQDVKNLWTDAIDKKATLLDALEQLKKESENSGDVWKSRAYGGTIRSIKKLNIPIVSGAQSQKLKGIGKGIASHIDEVIKTGKLESQEERIQRSILRGKSVDIFLKIWGVGPKIANAWYDKGYRDIEDLVSEKLTDQQRIGIKYYTDIQEKIPRDEAESIFNMVRAVLKNITPGVDLEMVGSYRRGATELGDIDVLITTKKNIPLPSKFMEDIVGRLKTQGVIVEDPVMGKEKFMGIAKLPDAQYYRRIDLRLIPREDWGVSLLAHTGSQNFNILLRQQASQMGYKLNEKGLYKLTIVGDDEKIPTVTEEDVFKELGMKPVPPNARE